MIVKEKELISPKQKVPTIEWVGLTLLFISLIILFVNPGLISGIFDAMVQKVFPVITDAYLTGTLGTSIILSVLIGRILERLGFTDALVRVFTPLAKTMKITPLVIVPAIYNILGDINASGRITAPSLRKAGATKDEQKIAIVTMCQSQQSFSTFMLGLLAFTKAGYWAFPIIVIVVFVPVVTVPFILSRTIYRDVQYKDVKEMPRFTPTTPALPTIFNGAREGAELLFLLLIPAAAAVFALIGALDFLGIWESIESALSSFLTVLSIDPKTGMQSILVSPTLAMNTLVDTIKTIPPKMAIGSFILASSGLPIQIPLAQIPAVWSENSDLTAKEALKASLLGMGIRMATAFILSGVLVLFI